jgi:hypothetical protein
MYFINSAKTSIVIYTRRNYDRVISRKKTERIQDGGTLDQGQELDEVESTVYADRDGFREVLADTRFLSRIRGYTFVNTAPIVITHHLDYRFVDWDTVSRPITLQPAPAGTAADGAIEVVAMVATAIIAGLTTGLAAIGPMGALPAGAIAGVGFLILTLLGSNQAQPEGPATSTQVNFIVSKAIT